MSQEYWSESAWSSALGSAWPRLVGKGIDRDRVLPSLLAAWDERVGRIHSSILSEDTRSALKQLTAGKSHRLAAGYEIVHQAAVGDDVAYWFLDAGSAAWGIVVERLLALLGQPSERIQTLLATWRTRGLADMAAELEKDTTPRDHSEPLWLNLLRALSLLYVHRRPEECADTLDKAFSIPQRDLSENVGVSLPITYALAAALAGDISEGADILTSALDDGHWQSAERAELTYHELRLRRALAEEDITLRVLELVRIEPAMLIRVLTDPAWGDVGDLREALREDSERLRSEMIRWQRRVPAEASDPFAQVRELLRMGGDLYTLYAAYAARMRALADGAEEPFIPPASFSTHIRDIRDFVRRAPTLMPLRVGRGTDLVYGKGSILESIENTLSSGEPTPRVVEQCAALNEILPEAVKVGLYEHSDRLLESLRDAYQIARAGKDSEYTLALRRWGQRCVVAGGRIDEIPEDTSDALGRIASDIWGELEAIEHEWAEAIKRKFGQLQIEVQGETSVPAGEWKALRCVVVDVGGTPVPGVPVVWSVSSGPARAKEDLQCMGDMWAQSLKTGILYMAIEVPADAPKGAAGSLDARILGSREPSAVQYSVS